MLIKHIKLHQKQKPSYHISTVCTMYIGTVIEAYELYAVPNSYLPILSNQFHY